MPRNDLDEVREATRRWWALYGGPPPNERSAANEARDLATKIVRSEACCAAIQEACAGRVEPWPDADPLLALLVVRLRGGWTLETTLRSNPTFARLLVFNPHLAPSVRAALDAQAAGAASADPVTA